MVALRGELAAAMGRKNKSLPDEKTTDKIINVARKQTQKSVFAWVLPCVPIPWENENNA